MLYAYLPNDSDVAVNLIENTSVVSIVYLVYSSGPHLHTHAHILTRAYIHNMPRIKLDFHFYGHFISLLLPFPHPLPQHIHTHTGSSDTILQRGSSHVCPYARTCTAYILLCCFIAGRRGRGPIPNKLHAQTQTDVQFHRQQRRRAARSRRNTFPRIRRQLQHFPTNHRLL